MAAKAEAPTEAPSERASDTEAAAAPSRAMPALSWVTICITDITQPRPKPVPRPSATTSRLSGAPRPSASRQAAAKSRPTTGMRRGRPVQTIIRPVSAEPQTMPAVSGSSCSPASAELEPSVSCR